MLRWAVLLLALLGIVGPARPQPRADAPDDAVTVFVLGNLQFLVVHEMAHMVIGELGVPVLGPEENAADYLAAAALIRADRRSPAASARNGEYLLAAADAQRLSWVKGTGMGAPVPYWDSHALTIQRFFQITCLLYGADPDTYADLPGRIGMPAERAAGCATEFQRTDRAINWLLSAYGRKPGEPPGEALEIRYEAPPTLVSQRFVAEMQRAGLIDAVVGRIGELFRLPRKATIVMRRCGRAEAAWRPERQELVVCYELVDMFYRMSAERGRSAGR
jgi:hypothetical protein